MAAENEGDEHTAGPEAPHPVSAARVREPEPDPAFPAGGSPPTEWTVSDRRGPLSAAESPDGVERVVPGSEIDAEGAHDPSSLALPPHAAPNATVEDASPPRDIIEQSAPIAPPPRSDADALKPPAATPPAPRRSLWPVAAGIVVGALIGGGSAAYVDTQHPYGFGPPESPRLAQLSSRVDSLEKRPNQQADNGLTSQIADLGRRVGALETVRTAVAAAPAQVATAPALSPPPARGASAAAEGSARTATAPPPPPLDGLAAEGEAARAAPQAPPPAPTFTPDKSTATASTGALVAQIAALQATVDGLQRRDGSSELTQKFQALQASVNGNQAAASAARSDTAALKNQQQDLGGKITSLQDAITGAQKQAATVQSGLATLQSQQKSLEGKLGAPALGVVADSLVEQIQAGRPFSTQVDALAALSADPSKIAILRGNAVAGVPSAKTLLLEFQPLVDPVIATGTRIPVGSSFLTRLKYGVLSLVQVRRADETTGSDLPSRVEAIRADLARNDVLDAYATWTALPPDAKQKSAAWGDRAKTSVEAIGAARDVQSGAITSLIAKRS